MTIADFLHRYALEGAGCMQDVHEKCRNVCIRTLCKRKVTMKRASDIFTDALIILFENAQNDKIKPGSALLSTYVVRTCLNLLSDDDGFPLMPISELPDGPEGSGYEEDEWLKHLKACLEKLPSRHRELIELWMKGLPHKTIAEILKYSSEDSSKSTFSQILSTLRKCLGLSQR